MSDFLIVDCSGLEGGTDRAYEAMQLELGHHCVDVERRGDDLRELVEEWRDEASGTALRNGGDRYTECADDLENLIDE